VDRSAYSDWHARWQDRIASERHAHDLMRAANPVLIPRNHRIEAMIEAAVAGDMAPFHELMAALAHPDDDNPEFAHLRRPPTQDEIVPATFCGT
jgi:uncharacterized protein YdiU (UPF0061 family)